MENSIAKTEDVCRYASAKGFGYCASVFNRATGQ